MVITINLVNIRENLNGIICAKHLYQCLEHRINIGYYFSSVWITQVCGRNYQGEAASIFPLYSSFRLRQCWIPPSRQVELLSAGFRLECAVTGTCIGLRGRAGLECSLQTVEQRWAIQEATFWWKIETKARQTVKSRCQSKAGRTGESVMYVGNRAERRKIKS